ncbi:class I tRNA ligase family protein, partial [Bacillus thuringiensis]|uniref:class I tRNA ligase family protein n=1 Tax=Bacillus thuringiensis TaxID=1428 RepID=UPI0011A40F58
QHFDPCFPNLPFTYHSYTPTDTHHHHQTVQNLFLPLLQQPHIYKKTLQQAYCQTSTHFLPDPYLQPLSPHCHQHATPHQSHPSSPILHPLHFL